MCIVSNVGDIYQHKWVPYDDKVTITRYEWEEYQRLKRNAIELDKLTKQPECRKPEYEKWEKEMEKFLKKKGIL